MPQRLRGAPGPARVLRSPRRRVRASYPIRKLPAQQMNQPSVSIFASLPELLLIPPNAFAAFFFFSPNLTRSFLCSPLHWFLRQHHFPG